MGAGVDSHGLFLRPSRSRDVIRLKLVRPASVRLNREGGDPGGREAKFGDVIFHQPDPAKVLGPSGTSKVRWKLRNIQFGDATLWLDTRGLIHLAMRRDSQQLTVVLDCDAPAIWFSDGTCWGNEYYLREPRATTSGAQTVQNWYEDWLRSTKWWQQ